VIAYVDSSVVARAYLADGPGHDDAVTLLEQSDLGLVTGTWTRIEVSSALVRATRSGRGDEVGLLALLDADLGVGGPVAVVSAPTAEVEAEAMHLVRTHGLRAMDAWHLATAQLTLPGLLEPGEEAGFASRDQAQSEVAALLGLRVI